MIDTEQVLIDLQTLINGAMGPTSSAGLKFVSVLVEAMERDLILDAMPLLNIVPIELRHEVLDLPNSYYWYFDIQLLVYTYDFTSREKAAIIRGQLLNAVQDVVRTTANLFFSPGIAGSKLTGRTQFARGTSAKNEGHVTVASTVLQVEGNTAQI